MLSLATLDRLAEEVGGPLVIDEAYVDFADWNALPLLKQHRNVIITRSLSKSYGLAGIRFGFAIANAAVVHELIKVKDSYNCDVLSLAAAVAALEDQTYLRETLGKIRETRGRLAQRMRDLEFDCTPSHANFVWCRDVAADLQYYYDALKKQRVLVRYMRYADYGEGLRISVGSDKEIDAALDSIRQAKR
jgi:histidinol-phosphate aminotransferase